MWNATYLGVAAGEYGISMIALFFLGIFYFRKIRRQNDPLRTPFLYLKLAVPCYFVSVLASTTVCVLGLLVNSDRNYSTILATIRIFTVPTCFFMSSLGDVQIIFCIVELNLSFFRAIIGSSGSQPILRLSALAAAVPLLMLCIATFSVHQTYYSEVMESDTYKGTRISARTITKLYASWSIIHFIIGLGLSLVVFRLYHNFKQYIKLTRRLLAVTILNNVRTIYDLYITTYYFLPDRNFPPYIIIVSPILYFWTTIVMLSLLSDIGGRKHDGLWSNPNSTSNQHPNNNFRPNPADGTWNGGNTRANARGWSEYQHPPPPAYGQHQ